MLNRNYFKILQAAMSGCLDNGTVIKNTDIFPSLINTGGYSASNTQFGTNMLLLVRGGISKTLSTIDLPIRINQNVSGLTTSVVNGDTMIHTSINGVGMRDIYIGFGDGSVEENFEDFTLSGNLINMSGCVYSISYQIDYDVDLLEYIYTARITVFNNSTTTKKVSELGLFTSVQTSYGDRTKCAYMIYRKQFPELSIEPTDAKIITLKIVTPQYSPIA